MKKAFFLLILAIFLFMAAILQATDPEDILRNLPSPEVNYPVEAIRMKPLPATPATAPVPLPPPARPYEARKLVEKAKETTSSPIVKTTRKIVEVLSRPKAKVATHTHAPASATKAPASSTANLATAKSQQTAQPTWVVKAARTLAENPVFTMLDARIASESEFARDVFDLYVQGYESEETPAEEEQPVAKFDSIMVTASGLQKKAQWQELKNLFSENPEAGETVEGLKFQIEAEINSAKPNYMNAQRFARQLLESESDDPLGHYALALFHYNSKKPNLVQAKKSLSIALKAKEPPAGASALYWTMTLKGLAVPLLLIIAGLAGGVAHIVKKKKAAAAMQAEGEETQAKDAGPAASVLSETAPATGLKAKLRAISERVGELLKKIPFGKGKGNQQPAAAENAVKDSIAAAETGEQGKNPAEKPGEEEIESSEEDEEIYELEGEDSELLDESDDSDADEEAAHEQATADITEASDPDAVEVEEIIEELVVEEDNGENAPDEVETVEIEEEEEEEDDDDGEVETVEEIIEEIVEEEEEIEEVEEVEEEVEYEDESEEKS